VRRPPLPGTNSAGTKVPSVTAPVIVDPWNEVRPQAPDLALLGPEVNLQLSLLAPGPSDPYRRSHRLLMLLIVAHVFVITLFPWIARYPEAVWDDMLEAWSWGQHFQLGYYKHPPFYAWVAGVWLRVFPRTDFNFYLLSALNIWLALAGIWRLSGLLLRKYARFPTVSLLLFAPAYHYMATNFNANTIQLSLWPWAAFFFVRSLQTRHWKDGVLFGALGGCALLSKYYSILLLASCLAAALLHPDRRPYFRSAAPYCAIATCAIIFAPHAMWTWENGFSTVHYALEKSQRPWWHNTYAALSTGVVGATTNLASTLVLLSALGLKRLRALIPRLRHSWMAADNFWLTVLALGPLVLTFLLGFVGYVKITPNYLIPTVYMVPLIVCRGLGSMLSVARVQDITRWAAAFMLFALLIAPLIAYSSVAFHFNDKSQISPRVAMAATQAWRERIASPLRIATGTEPFSLALPFYSSEGPVEFTHYSFMEAPWITLERIEREGILYACAATDALCIEAATAYATGLTTRLSRTFHPAIWRFRGPDIEVVFFMTPPRVRRTPS
jgi:4-amino-4-deoxy-L-arabinose transferase-like glycosyltransferase